MKNYNKLSLWLNFIAALTIVASMILGILSSVNIYLASYMDARAISTLVINSIAYGGVMILGILFIIFSFIKRESTYSFHGILMLVASVLFAITLIYICQFGVSLKHGWNEIQLYLITALCYLILGIGYIFLIFYNNNIKTRRIIFLLSIVLVLLFTSMLVHTIIDGEGSYLISLYSILIASQIAIIVDCVLYRQ